MVTRVPKADVRKGIRRGAIEGLAATALASALAFYVVGTLGGPSPEGVLKGLLPATLALFGAILLLVHYRQRYLMGLLQDSFLDAQEGILEPVRRLPGVRLGFADRLIDDYNDTLSILRYTFATVEECQGRAVRDRNRIDALLQSLPGALVGVDENLKINWVNREACELFARCNQELKGEYLFEIISVGERGRDMLRDLFLYKRSAHNQEIDIEVAGEWRSFSLNLSFLSPEETDMGAVITLQDMTDHKRLQESVAYREKLVAMGQMAGGVAHELNTPLGNILGYARLCQEKSSDHTLARYLEIIGEEAKRCSRITHDLLNYARKDKCDGAVCDLNAMAQEVVETFVSCRMRKRNIQLHTDYAPGQVFAQGGCGEIEIVLTNLLLNAIQALQGRPSGNINVSTWPDRGFVYLAVEDDGPGVPREIRARIFDPFFTTKDVGEGSGLGLAIGQAMMAKRGGRILFEPSPRGGARFVLQLPEEDDGGSNDGEQP